MPEIMCDPLTQNPSLEGLTLLHRVAYPLRTALTPCNHKHADHPTYKPTSLAPIQPRCLLRLHKTFIKLTPRM